MHFNAIGIPAFILCVFNFSSIYADSWSVTQSVTTSNPLLLNQHNATGSTIQSVNLINLDQSSGVVSHAEQTLNAGGNNVSLIMLGSENSYQSVNYLAASEVVSATQNATNINEAVLRQIGGSNNVQAINVTKATGGLGVQISNLTQTVSANTLTLDYQGTGSGNIQAGNFIEADSISTTPGAVTQNFVVTTLNYTQSGTNNLQAGNVVIKSSASSTGSVTQNFTAGNVNANFSEIDPLTGSIKAANYYAERP